MATAKSVCTSGNSGFSYSKKNPPSATEQQIYWQDIYAAQRVAEYTYQVVYDCSKADLIIKTNLDLLLESVSLVVTDSDSGEAVFTETRSVQDTRNDLIRAAQHFRDAVKAARLAIQEQQERDEEAERERERQAKLAEKARQCQVEFESLRQMVYLYIDSSMPQQVLNEITDHNSKCPNTISPEKIKSARKAEEAANLAQLQAAKDKSLREKRLAELQKEKTDALVAFKQQLVLTPFVPPTEGWMRALPLMGPYYIILPGRKWETNDCHFKTDGAKPILDCLGAGAGRNNYFSVQNNDRWYLLKSKWSGSGEYAGTVKDGGTTVCLRKAGCYHVLAEVRQVPSELPEKFQVPSPEAPTHTYSSDDFSFNYPQNWKADERKNKDNTITAVQVSAPEAHLASWVTHGVFVGHVRKFDHPQTLDGAYDLFANVQRQRGLVIGADKLTQAGNGQAKIATYTSPSVLQAGESGWIVVVKDKGEGYYWLMMFYPSNDDSTLYTQTFGEILKSFNFKE